MRIEEAAQQYNTQIEDLQKRVSACQAAVSTVFCDTFYNAHGFDYNAFFDAVYDRATNIETQRNRAAMFAAAQGG